MNLDKNTTTVHFYTDSEIAQIIGTSKQQASEENSEEDVAERISIYRLIKLTGELLKGLEQRNFICEQFIINCRIK